MAAAARYSTVLTEGLHVGMKLACNQVMRGYFQPSIPNVPCNIINLISLVTFLSDLR